MKKLKLTFLYSRLGRISNDFFSIHKIPVSNSDKAKRDNKLVKIIVILLLVFEKQEAEKFSPAPKLCHMVIGSECKWHIKVSKHNVIDLVEREGKWNQVATNLIYGRERNTFS